MRRRLFLVAQHHEALYDWALQELSDNEHLQVIRDRRFGERRQGQGATDSERRRGDRRLLRPNVDAELAARGHAVVFLTE
ncbi:MAG TPA: hypothetical protein VGV13_14020 [Methylomirabilota bacterium]|jgi:hypothetical protein|nr:hypothetical protein [Methylomirabilota bacterium]